MLLPGVPALISGQSGRILVCAIDCQLFVDLAVEPNVMAKFLDSLTVQSWSSVKDRIISAELRPGSLLWIPGGYVYGIFAMRSHIDTGASVFVQPFVSTVLIEKRSSDIISYMPRLATAWGTYFGSRGGTSDIVDGYGSWAKYLTPKIGSGATASHSDCPAILDGSENTGSISAPEVEDSGR